MSGKLNVRSATVQASASRIHEASSRSGGFRLRLGQAAAQGAHSVAGWAFATVIDDVMNQLEAKVPYYISLVIDSYAQGIIGVADTVEHADHVLGQAGKSIHGAQVTNAKLLGHVATSPGNHVIAAFGFKVHHLEAGDYATLSEISEHYDKVHDQLPGGWTVLGSDELRKLDIDPNSLHDNETGFDAEIFRGPDGQYVVAYGGTRGGLFDQDWQNNKVGHFATSAQENEALALATRVDAATHGNVVFTGHSLGGQLAAISSLATGREAVTFDAPPVSEATMLRATGRGLTVLPPQIDTSMITNYWAGGDEVTLWAGRGIGTNVKVVVDASAGQAHHDIQLLVDALPHAGPEGVDDVPLPSDLA